MTSRLAIDALRDAVARLPDNRLSATRLAALDHLQGQGTPTTAHEDWKYTDLSDVIDISNQWLAHSAQERTPDVAADQINALKDRIDAYWLVIANGQVDESSVAVAQAAGISVSLLSDADVALDFDAPLANLNTALLRDGLRIHVEADAQPAKPIGILIVDDASSAVGVSQARVEIDLAERSTASLIEHHVSTGRSRHYANSIVRLVLGDHATARYVRIQERDSGHSQTGRLNVRMGRDSSFEHSAFDFGGKLSRNDLLIDLCGPGALATFTGLYIAVEGQHIDNHTRVDHRVGPAKSIQEYRGILAGATRCVWNGKAIVHAGADGTDAEQANHNLLLSEQSEIDAKPELEIYADDVKCSHGTTIGQLDESALYYLRTRGLDRRHAQQLLTQAFAQSIVDRVSIDLLQDTLREMVAVRLSKLIEGDIGL